MSSLYIQLIDFYHSFLNYQSDTFFLRVDVAIVLALLVVVRKRFNKLFDNPRACNTISGIASFVVAIYVVIACIYLFVPQYCDFFEPDVVISTLNIKHGLPLYPDWSRGEGAYGEVYGPLLYAAVGAPLALSKSVLASKLATISAFLFSVAALWYQGHRLQTRAARFTAKFYLLALIPFGVRAFWVRPDPLLLALTAGGAIAAGSRKSTLRCLVLGACAGLAASLKIHAVFYFLPLAVFALVRAPGITAATLDAAAAAAGFIVALVGAFEANLEEAAALGRYLVIIAQRKPSLYYSITHALAILALSAPYLFALRRRWLGCGWDWRIALMAVSMAVSLSALIYVAAIPGAGSQHLMPIIPVLLFATLDVQGSKVVETVGPVPLLYAAMIAAAIPSLILTAIWLERAVAGAHDTTARYQEAANLAALYPGAQFGPTDSAHTGVLQYRVGAALSGAHLIFSPPAWSDRVFSGLRPQDDPRDFSPGPLDWILPRDGVPFSSPLFSSQFQKQFKSRCRQIDRRQTFAVWRCPQGILDPVERAR